MNVHTSFDTTSLQRVVSPIDTACGLPNTHYVSQNTFHLEKQALWFDQWAGVGFGKDLPRNGYAKPVDYLGIPLLLVRDKQGVVRVFQNTCRHRGMFLMSEEGSIKGVLRCPYHSWCYSLKGELVTTPHIGGPGHNMHDAIDQTSLGLVEIRSHIWRDVIFVNVSGTAPPFEDYAAELIERWHDFERPLFHGGAESSFKLRLRSNWKLAVENYCESYHLPWVHPGLNSYSRLEDHYHIEQEGAFSGQGSSLFRQFVDGEGNCFADFEALPDKWQTASEYIALYPNVLFGVHKDHAFAILLQAEDVGTTVEHIELYYANETATSKPNQSLRKAHAAQWREVFEEDVFVVEGMHRGRHGPLFDGGRFSPAMDGPTHIFHRWAANQLLKLV